MPDEGVELLKRIDVKLSALLAIVIDRHLRETELAKPRPRSIDRMLVDVGLSNTEVARLLGKTPQAVGQLLLRDGKTAKRATRTSAGAPGSGTKTLTTESEDAHVSEGE